MDSILIKIILIGILKQWVNGVPVLQDVEDVGAFIVGGEDAPADYAPHTMGLVFGAHVRNLMCGASIVTDSHVVTAAHCITALIWEIDTLMPSLLGVYGSNKWTSTERNVKFSGYVYHPKWDMMDIKFDIGVLFLSEKLSPSDKWKAIPLNYDWVDAGENAYIVGWGSIWTWGPNPEKMQLLDVTTISHDDCLARAKEAAGFWVPIIIKEIEICTMHHKGAGHGMCHGDSGSALVSRKSNKQIGIVSWGFPCATGAPDMFVRLSGFRDFIESNINPKQNKTHN